MLSGPIRALGHVGAVVLLSGVGVLLTGTAGSAAAPDRPESYGGTATASALHASLNRQPGLFPAVDNPINNDMPYASTSLDSSGSATATAAPYTPGEGALGAPNLICQFASQICDHVTPPDYPFKAYAQYPSTPDSKAQVSSGTVKQGPAEVTLSSTTAHADPDSVEATTGDGGASIAKALSMGSAAAHSLQHFVGSTLVATTETTVHGLDIAGTLHIDAVRSTAIAHVAGGKVGTAVAKTTISGATLAGHAVTIDSHGIHADGHGDDNAVTQQVNSALKALRQAGISVRQLGVSRETRKGVATASTGGLLISFSREVDVKDPIPPLPVPVNPGNPSGVYYGSVIVAGAGVHAFATPAAPPLKIGPVTVPQPNGGGRPDAAPQDPTLTPPQQDSGPVTVPKDSGSTPDVAPPEGSEPQLASADLTWKKVRTLALVLLAYPALVLVGRPLRAPSRLPGSG